MLGKGFGSMQNAVLPNLALKGKGRFINRPTVTGGKKYDKYFVYIPTELAHDSQFPFKTGDDVEISVDAKKKRLIFQKMSANDL